MAFHRRCNERQSSTGRATGRTDCVADVCGLEKRTHQASVGREPYLLDRGAGNWARPADDHTMRLPKRTGRPARRYLATSARPHRSMSRPPVPQVRPSPQRSDRPRLGFRPVAVVDPGTGDGVSCSRVTCAGSTPCIGTAHRVSITTCSSPRSAHRSNEWIGSASCSPGADVGAG